MKKRYYLIILAALVLVSSVALAARGIRKSRKNPDEACLVVAPDVCFSGTARWVAETAAHLPVDLGVMDEDKGGAAI